MFPLFTERRSLDLLFCPCCCYWRLSWIPIPLTQSERFSEPPFQPSCHHTAVRAVPTGSEKWLWSHRRCDREIRPQPGESDVGSARGSAASCRWGGRCRGRQEGCKGAPVDLGFPGAGPVGSPTGPPGSRAELRLAEALAEL